jgi:hypothetical protein
MHSIYRLLIKNCFVGYDSVILVVKILKCAFMHTLLIYDNKILASHNEYDFVQHFLLNKPIHKKVFCTRLKTIRLLQYWWKQDWTILLHPIQHCWQVWTMWGQHRGSTTLFNPVKQRAHNFYACILGSQMRGCQLVALYFRFSDLLPLSHLLVVSVYLLVLAVYDIDV